MKKFLTLLILFASFILFGFISVKADGPTVVMDDGASIRTAAPAGLKFSATVSGDFSGASTVSYGFLLSRGTLSVNQMKANEAAGNTLYVNCGEPDGKGKIYVTVVGIPASGYDGNITAIAVIDVDGVKIYSENTVTRNIAAVAAAAKADPEYVPDAFVESIINTSSFVLNGGSFVYDYKFTIRGDGDAGSSVASGYTLNIASQENYDKACNQYWTRLYINRDAATGYYKIIAKGDEPAEYDYVLALHGTCTDAESKAVFTALASDANREDYYLKINIPAVHTAECEIEVIVDASSDKLRGTKAYFAANATLPTLEKEYYDFDGWCLNSDLSDSPVTQHPNEEISKTYYAKFTPINYTVQFNLQGGESSGSSSLANIIYNYETATIDLPAPGTMSIADGTFKGWYTNSTGTGDSITTIPVGSHGDMTIYACWNMNVHTPLEVSADDKTALEALTADIIVLPSARALDGSYYLEYSSSRLTGVYAEREYEYGVGAFASIDDALDYIDENNLTGKKVYIFAGTYDDELSIVEASTTLYGPSYLKAYNNRAVNEVNITALTTINAANVTIQGLKFTSSGNIKVSANNATISHCYITPSGTIATYGGNRKGCIADGAQTSGLTIEYSYICAPGTTQSYTTQYASFGAISNLTIRNCYITNVATTLSSDYAGMMIYNPSGTITIDDNEFHWPTNGYVMFIGQASNNVTSISIQGNLFTGSETLNSATIRISRGKSTLTTNIIENRFVNFAPSTFSFENDNGSTVNILYNYFNSQKQYRILNVGSAVYNYDYNFFEGGIAGTDASGANTNGHKVTTSSELASCIERFHNPNIDLESSQVSVINSVLPTIIVKTGLSSTFNSLDNDNLNETMKNRVYKLNVNAFTTISAAVAAASANDIIYVFAGSYNETFTISTNNISLIGPNYQVYGDSGSRSEEAEFIGGTITLAKNLAGCTISGFKFSGDSLIVNTEGDAGTAEAPATNVNGFTFSYNKVVSGLTSGEGFIYFVEAASSYSHDLVFAYNEFSYTSSGTTAMLYLDNLYNLNAYHNVFKNITGYALYVNDTTKGASGQSVLVNNNVFNTIGVNAIHLNWISYLPSPSSTAVVEANGNTFTAITGIGIYIGTCNAADTGYSHVQANNNTFNGIIGTPIKMNRVVANNKWYATGNTFNSVPTSGKYVVNGVYGNYSNSKFNIVATDNNYANSVNDDNFSDYVTH